MTWLLFSKQCNCIHSSALWSPCLASYILNRTTLQWIGIEIPCEYLYVGEFGFWFFRQQIFFSLCCHCSLALNRIWKSFQSQNVTRKVVALAINTRCKNKWQVALTFNNQASIKFDDLQIFGQEQWKYWILCWIAFCLWVMNKRSERIDQIASSFSQYSLITGQVLIN